MPSPVLYMLAQKARVPKSKAEEFWEKAKVLAKKKGLKDGTTEFYAYVTGILKRMMKIESSDKIVDFYLFESNSLIKEGAILNFFKKVKDKLKNKFGLEKNTKSLGKRKETGSIGRKTLPIIGIKKINGWWVIVDYPIEVSLDKGKTVSYVSYSAIFIWKGYRDDSPSSYYIIYPALDKIISLKDYHTVDKTYESNKYEEFIKDNLGMAINTFLKKLGTKIEDFYPG